MHRAVTSGRIQQSVQNYTLAEALSLNLEEDTITLPLVQELVDEWVTIDEADIASTMFEFLDHEGMLIEGAAACAVAAIAKKVINFKPREKVAVIICGGNVNRNDWREVVVDHLVGASRSA